MGAKTENTTPREWYRIKAQADPTVAEFQVFDDIGEVMDFWTGEKSGVSAKRFAADLQALPAEVKTVRVRVGSLGGDPFEGLIIANALRDQSQVKGRTVEMVVDFAASAATLLTSAGGVIRMSSNGFLMVHNPQGVLRACGDSKTVRAAAEDLATAMDSIRDSIVATYRWVSQLSAEALQAMMDKVTWMGPEEALANGFVTEIMDPSPVTACFRPEVVAKLGEIPPPYRERIAALTVPPVADVVPPEPPPPPPAPTADVPGILAECKAAGCLELAEELVTANASRDQAKARVTAAQEIKGLCAAAKLPALADGYIKARVPVADVKTHLTTITAKMDAVEITTTLPVDGDRPARPASRLNPSAIYAERNARIGQKGA